MNYWRMIEGCLPEGRARGFYDDVVTMPANNALASERRRWFENACENVLDMVKGFAEVEEYDVVGLEVDLRAFVDAMRSSDSFDSLVSIGTDFPISASDVSGITKLVFRGGIWCVLKHPHLEVHFPGGCAMIIGTDLEFDCLLRRIERMGFSVEPTERPTYEWEKDERTSKTGEF